MGHRSRMLGSGRGYATVSAPGKTHEADTLSCAHCQGAVFLHALPGHVGHKAPKPPGYCPHCHATVCNACAMAGGCEPFEEKIKKIEEGDARQRSMLRELGL